MSYGSMMSVMRSRDDGSRDVTRRYGRGDDQRMDGRTGERMERMGGYAGGYDGGYAGESTGGAEMAFRDRTGRRHYDNRRFAPMRSEQDDEPMNKIGFMREEEMARRDRREPSGQTWRDSAQVMRGREVGHGSVYEGEKGGWVVQGQFGGQHRERGMRPMDEAMAVEWTKRMKNEDGPPGAHWKMEQIEQLVQQRHELQEYDLPELFAVMNMVYSDYSKVAKKFNVNNMDFYICLAKAWLDDPDAPEDKTAKYYQYVVNG